ncbi:MAG: C25 family cysteine peptidase [Candidatus Thermoplasmatota archaeon]|nr:C25 family cysteine peptidase [Candidatus Thermoplasmatota archaeon]
MLDRLKRIKDDNREKFLVTLVLLMLLVATIGIAILNLMGGGVTPDNYETGSASIDDFLNINSVFNEPGPETMFIVSDSDPLYALAATPAAVYYSSSNASVRPLLVYQGASNRYSYTTSSPAVKRFIASYSSSNTTAYLIGDLPYGDLDVRQEISPIRGMAEEVSLEIANHFWTQSDAVILVEQSEWGYAEAVNTVPLAAYLNIPVIVANKMDEDIAPTLRNLGVKYSIVCGGIGGYGKTLRYALSPAQIAASMKVAEDWVKSNMDDLDVQRTIADHHQPLMADALIKVIRTRIGGDVNYVTMANPADTRVKTVARLPEGGLDQVRYSWTDSIQDSGARAYPGAAPYGNDGPSYTFSVPYQFSNLIIDLKMDVSEATGPLWSYLNPGSPIEKNADGSGERIYAFIGVDLNEDGILDTESEEVQFFGGSPGYDFIREGTGTSGRPMWAHFRIELPFYNPPKEEHIVQLLGKLPTVPSSSAKFELEIIVQNLTDPTYPLMPGLSSMAPYLTAYRRGVVLAKENYQLHTPGYSDCLSCGIPAASGEAAFGSNEEVKVVKADFNNLLARLAGMDKDPRALAEHYAELAANPTTVQYLGIMADTNMIPMYYYPSNALGDATQGFGVPSDTCYMDIDADLDDPPYNLDFEDASYEVAAGRITGWDAQDVSVLVSRTIFYDRILSEYKGPLNTGLGNPQSLAPLLKDSVMTSVGTQPPVGVAATAAAKLSSMMEAAGMTPNRPPWGLNNEMSRRQYSQPFYESANILYVCAHGFYYWYVPAGQEGMMGITAATGAGGAYDVTHVKDMALGPGTMFVSSCVTGRIDGIPGRNALSQAFLHAGLNAYIGATRSSWGSLVPIPDDTHGESLGDLLMLYTFSNLCGYIYDKDGGLIINNQYSGTSIGFAFMNGKNRYLEHEGGTDNGGTTSDTVHEFVLYGDPAFKPYINSPGPGSGI